MNRWTVGLALLGIVVASAWLRFWNADIWPVGLEYDEGLQGVDALAVASGQFRIFFREAYREPLSIYAAAPFVAWFGHTAFAVRLAGMLAGIASVPLAYFCASSIFAGYGRDRARLIGLITAAFTGLTLWPLIVSRTAIPAPFVPPVMAACMWATWRAWLGRGSPFLAGFLLGLVVYTYQPGKLAPLVLGLFLALDWLIRRRDSVLVERFRSVVVVAAISLVTVAPLLVYYAFDPGGLFGRAGAVSIFRPALGNPVETAIRTTGQALGAFAFAGDPNWHHNISGRPILEPLVALLTVIGLIALIVRFRSPGSLFVVSWLAVMILPGILAEDNNPNTLRLIGMVPAIFMLPALGIDAGWLAFRGHRLRLAVPVVAAALMVYQGFSTREAFAFWAANPSVFEKRSGEAVDLAAWMNANGKDPNQLILLPISASWSETRHYRHRSTQFLYTGQSPYVYQRIDDEAPPELPSLCETCTHVALAIWHAGPHIDADPKNMARFLLERVGVLEHEEQRRGYDILTYSLVQSIQSSLQVAALPRPVRGADGLNLVGFDVSQTASGRGVAFVTRWQRTAELGDVKLSYRVRVPGSSGQTDRPLLANSHLPTSEWTVGDSETDYVVVPLQPGFLPGKAEVEVVPYGVPNAMPISLGILDIVAPRVPYTPMDLDTDIEIGWQRDGYTLIGAQTTDVPDGIILYWRYDSGSLPLPNVNVTAASGANFTEFQKLPQISPFSTGQMIADRRIVPGLLSGSTDIRITDQQGATIAVFPLQMAGR